MRLRTAWFTLTGDRGSILLGSLMLLLVLTFLGAGLFNLAVVESRMVGDAENTTQAFYTAEAGLNRAWQEMANGIGTNAFDQVYALADGATFIPTATLSQNTASVKRYSVVKVLSVATSPLQVRVRSTGSVTSVGGGTLLAQAQTSALFQRSPTLPWALFNGETADGLEIAGSALLDSFNSATAAYDPAHPGSAAMAGSNGPVKIGSSAIVKGNVTVRGAMTNSGQVQGNATAGGSITGSGTVTGTSTPSASPAPATVTLDPVAACGPPYASGSGLTGSGYSYAPGTGLTGGGNVTLANGTYCFKSISYSGTLTVNGPVVIYLTGRATLSGPIVNTTGKAVNLQILSSYVGPDDGVLLNGGSQAFLTVYAPATEIKLTPSGTIFGALMGKWVELQSGAKLHYDEALKTSSGLVGGIGSWQFASWTRDQ